MEPQPYLPHHQNPSQIHEESSSTTNSGGKSSFLCRQSSTRWIPTSDQIRILKDLYYNSGIRSPSAEQIQRISAKLRQYGKIEGKNVFYWFQNHKARERQKKRFSVDVAAHNNKYTSTTYNGFSSSSSATSPPSFMGIGQVGAAGYGASYMEKGFRDCSISGARGNEGCMINSFSWTGSTTEQSPSLFPRFETELKLGGGGKDIETLQLFPMHDQEGYEEEEEDQLHRHGNGYCISGNNSVDNYIHGWFLGEQGPVGGGSFATTSLELSLGSSFPGAGHRA